METTGYSRWFGRLLAELGFEVWIGDAAEIKTRRAKKKKTDREDTRLLLKLLLEDRFPRIWVPSLRIGTLSLLLPVRCSAMISTTGVGMSAQREWKDFFLPNGMGLLCMPVNQD